jgi:hypothetical protein
VKLEGELWSRRQRTFGRVLFRALRWRRREAGGIPVGVLQRLTVDCDAWLVELLDHVIEGQVLQSGLRGLERRGTIRGVMKEHGVGEGRVGGHVRVVSRVQRAGERWRRLDMAGAFYARTNPWAIRGRALSSAVLCDAVR